MEIQKQKEFIYSYQHYSGKEKTLQYSIQIPYKGNVNELGHEIVSLKMDSIMKMQDAHLDLSAKLKEFVENENQLYYCNYANDLLQKARTGQIDLDGIIKNTERQYKNEILEFSDRIGFTDEEIFAQSFHCLVHSSMLPDILAKEKTYAKLISSMNRQMDEEISAMTNSHQTEIEDKIQQLDVSTTTEHINNLLSQQQSLQNYVWKKWESETEAIKGHQKNEYIDWITTQVAKTLNSKQVSTPIMDRSPMLTALTPSKEESFTIHLGSQLKHMHNIRILCADINDICRPLYASDESLSGLNTALELYSSFLSGVVVLTPSGSIQRNRQIFKNANMSTEFHFDQINDQLDKITHEKLNTMPSGTNRNGGKFKPGDFYITRHSNLSQMHIIFHLVSDESFESPDEINSRHPVILGLRNILKTASKYDVTSLTIPALLRHEMCEDMTIPWCVRRAELIFKCAKGFMIESASWGGAEISTLQLLLPPDLSDELFGILVGMVPHVFRVANPKILHDNTK